MKFTKAGDDKTDLVTQWNGDDKTDPEKFKNEKEKASVLLN